jgi:putative membrane protein
VRTTTEDTALTDNQFVRKALAGGKLDAELAKLAVEQSNDPQIKQFAQALVDDHSKVTKELMALKNGGTRGRDEQAPEQDRTQRRNGKLPGDRPQLLERFTQLHGAEFDRAFLHQILQDHEKAVMLFDKEAKTGQDASAKSFAEKTLPTLKKHLKMARELAERAPVESRRIR